ncbi:hypothetical protein RDABS01_011277 [Bienertia sinuspersici]
MQRRERNQIKPIKDEAGTINDDETHIMEAFVSYFENLFKAGDCVELAIIIEKVQTMISTEIVDELIEDGIWKESLIRDIFSSEEAAGILQIPISRYETSEDWVWHYSKIGGFTVRSAYFVELEGKKGAGTTSTSTSNKGASKTLWKALVPPKVKMFGWRVLHGGVPVRKKLKLRGMEIDERCPMCGDSEESILHMLFRCNEAEVIWRYLPLRLEFHPDKFSCIKGWLEFLACTYKDGIWRKRNEWVFQTKRISGEQVVHKAVSLVGEVEEANRKDLRSRNSEVGGSIWQPPHQLWYKLNSDAAIFEGGMLGLRAVVRGHVGDVMAATCWYGEGSKEVEVAEALAARHGLGITIEVGLTSIILETDCIKLYQHLKKGKREASYFGKIVQDILHLAKRCNCISYAHIKRSGNRVAHELAKVSKDYSEMMVLIKEVPPSMHNYVMADVLSLNS